jgi:hypothetical protein
MEKKKPPPKRKRNPKTEAYSKNNSIDRYWGQHKDEDIFVVGTGTSLHDFNWDKLKEKITVGLNDAVKFVPELTYHFFSDRNLFKQRYAKHEISENTIVVCQQDVVTKRENCHKFCDHLDQMRIFSRIPNPTNAKKEDSFLFVNSTVATGGVMMAYKLGAKRIYIMGIDAYCYKDKYYADGQNHRNKGGDKRSHKKMDDGRIVQDRHKNWNKQMGQLKEWLISNEFPLGTWPEPGVYNLSEKSEISVWEKVDINKVLQ